MFDIKDELAKLPASPGVYLHKDCYGEIIYVGKASSLRSRVRQYFAPPASLDPKTRALAARIAEFEYIVTGTEAEALLLENTLIKRHRPRYNVMLLDDKTYPYLKITMGERYPRLVKTRVLASDGSRYFGPYADVGALNRIAALLNDGYRLKRCARQEFPADWRPCLNGFIGACDRCCKGEVQEGEYAGRIRGAADFLRGRDKGLVSELRERMKGASERQEYEEAAKWRDLIHAAEAVTRRQKVDLLSSSDMDILLAAEAQEGRMAQAVLFFVRDGRLVGREPHHLDAEAGSTKKEIAAAFLKQYYANQTMIPKEILLEEPVDDAAAIEAFLGESVGDGGVLGEDGGHGDCVGSGGHGGFTGSGGHGGFVENNGNAPAPAPRRVRLTVPERGRKHDLLLLAQNDMRGSAELREGMLAAREEKQRRAVEALVAIISEPRSTMRNGEGAGEAGVCDGDFMENNGNAPSPSPSPSPAPRLEAYDISNTGGTDAVGAMVVFRGAEKSRRDYRRFRIRSDDGADDYGSMQEVVYRRFRRFEAGEKGFDEKPSAILVDGGAGHVHAVAQALAAMGLDIPVLGMVKNDRHRTRGLVYGGSEISLSPLPDLYHLIGAIQEEVHRFAIDYHRGVRAGRQTRSELDSIPGIGEKRRTALLLKFGSIDAIRGAGLGELAATPGMDARAAKSVYAHWHGETP